MSVKAELKGFIVRTDARLTSTGAGGGTLSVAQSAKRVRDVQSALPSFTAPHVVRKISKDLHCSETEGLKLFGDLMAFLWMTAQSTEPRVPSPAIDEAWHTFILFTKDYAEFCEVYCGGFIHHLPHTGPDASLSVSMVQPTIEHAIALFGSKPSGNWDYTPFKEWRAAA